MSDKPTKVFVTEVFQKTAPDRTWVESGYYELVRWFDHNRAMIRLSEDVITLVTRDKIIEETK